MMYKQSRFNAWTQTRDGSGVYLYNTYTSALLEISSQDWVLTESILHGGNGVSDFLDHKLRMDYVREVLVPGGYMVPKDLDEVECLRSDYYRLKQSTQSFGLTIAPCMGCNLACKYCYASNSPDDAVMSEEIQNGVVRFAQARLASGNVKAFNTTWVGGEPTLGFEAIVRLTREFRRLCEPGKIGYSSGIITNGTLVTAEMAAAMKEECCISFAQLTMDSYAHDQRRSWRKGAGSGSSLAATIRAYTLLKPLMTMAVRINVDRDNASVDELVRFSSMLAESGVDQKDLYLAIVESTTDRNRHYVKPLLERDEFADIELEWRQKLGIAPKQVSRAPLPCGLTGDSSLTIDPQGYISKCWQYIGDKEKRLGHICDGVFPLHNCRPFMQQTPFEDPNCRQCFALPVCGGGCPAFFLGNNQTPGTRSCHWLKHKTQERLMLLAEHYGEANSCPGCGH